MSKTEIKPRDVFGEWVVVEEKPKSSYNNRRFSCICSCGIVSVVWLGHLISGKSTKCKSCASKKHGLSKHPLYSAWSDMNHRCYNKRNKRYIDWGGRGVTVCDRWKDSLENFISDMGEKPSPSHSLDRIDNDGNYEPSNCKWSTPSEQNSNQRMKKSNTSGVSGVHWDKSKKAWVAALTRYGKITLLGSFKNKECAIEARMSAEHGYTK